MISPWVYGQVLFPLCRVPLCAALKSGADQGRQCDMSGFIITLVSGKE